MKTYLNFMPMKGSKTHHEILIYVLGMEPQFFFAGRGVGLEKILSQELCELSVKWLEEQGYIISLGDCDPMEVPSQAEKQRSRRNLIRATTDLAIEALLGPLQDNSTVRIEIEKE